MIGQLVLLLAVFWIGAGIGFLLACAFGSGGYDEGFRDGANQS